MTRPRLLLAAVVLLVASGCASATQPALRVGDAEYSRAELNDLVAAELGRDLDPVELRQEFYQAIGSALGEDITNALTAGIDAAVTERGLVPDETDAETVRVAFGLPENFDPEALDAESREGYEFQLRVFALQRVLEAEGSSLDEALASVVELDPRYGRFTATQGFVPPVAPPSAS